MIAALAGVTNAWFDTGHLLVARIAYEILQNEDPAQLQKANAILAELKANDPSAVSKEGAHPFVECAPWADSFKYNGGLYQKEWHFIDQPFLDEGGTINDYPNFVGDTHNAKEALKGIIEWMNNPDANNYVVQTIKTNALQGSMDNAYSTALRLMIHYVGDIHQPLHATARVDHEYPKGDFGGNLVHLPKKDGVTNLHASWDSVAYEFSGYANLPFSDNDWNLNGSRAKVLMSNHADIVNRVNVHDLNPDTWANESFTIAKNYAYNGVHDGVALTPEYVSAAKTEAEEQIVVAGHRLANLIKGLNFNQYAGNLFLN